MFISSASDKMTSLMNLHKQTVHEIQEMAVYFGENRNYKSPEEIFKIFADFIAKFEVLSLMASPGTFDSYVVLLTKLLYLISKISLN